MDGKVNPGLFHLPLPINQDASNDAIRRKEIDIEHDLKAREGRVEELAILNLLGLFKFRREEYEAAEQYFRKVLSKDEHNLNALANLEHLLEEVDRSRDATSFKHKLDSQRGDQRARARCLAEQAYAYACDLHTDQCLQDRFIKSNDIFQEAIDLAADLVETSERGIWKFCMAKNSHKIFNCINFDLRPFLASAEEYMEKAVKLFHEITQREPGDPEYMSESWRHLADIFRKIQRRKKLRSHNLPKELKPYIDDPEKCMVKAMEISPNNPRLLARYANFVYSLRRGRSKDALELLDQSISLDKSDFNYYAFSTRGRILVEKLKRQMEKADKDRSLLPLNKSRLDMAKSDLEQATTFRSAVWDLINMAELLHLFALSCTDESNETRRGYLEKELAYLRRATKCESGECKKHVSSARGQCLFDLGEYRESIACFKEAIDKLSKTTSYVAYSHGMFRSYLCLLRSESKNARDDTPLLTEMADSLKQAVGKHGVANLIKYCFSSLQVEYQNELLLLTEHCKQIPNNEHMLEVLNSQEPPSPLSPPVRKGGILSEIWLGSSQPEPDQSTTPDIASSASNAEEAVNPAPTLEITGKGMNEADDPQPQGEPRVECTAVTKREDFGDLAKPAAAGAVATTQPGPGQIVNIQHTYVNINATNSPLNFGTTHGNVNKYELPITEGRRGEVSSKEIEMLTQWKKAIGEDDLEKLMSEGLKHVQQRGGLPVSSADAPSQTLTICEAGEPSASSGESGLSPDDATGVPKGAVASVASGIGNMDITEPSVGNSAKPAPQMQE